MNVERAPAKRLYERRGEQAHVTGQADQLDAVCAQRRDDLAVMLFALAPAALDDQSLDSPLGRASQSRRVPLIADHNGDLGFRNSSLIDGIGERQHVRAAP